MADERREFRARTEALPDVADWVESRCEALRVPRRTALRLRLVAEELFINSVDHGYGGDSVNCVTVSLRLAGEEVELDLEDRGVAFNPFEDISAAPETGDPDRRGVGGLGRVLVFRLCSRHEYRREGEVNRVRVALRRAVGPEDAGGMDEAGSRQ